MNENPTHKERLFELMRDGKWHHMAALQRAGGWRYGGRLFELQREGWPHEKRRIGPNEWEYRLLVGARQFAMELR